MIITVCCWPKPPLTIDKPEREAALAAEEQIVRYFDEGCPGHLQLTIAAPDPDAFKRVSFYLHGRFDEERVLRTVILASNVPGVAPR